MIHAWSRRATERWRSLVAVGRVAPVSAALIVMALACRADRAVAVDEAAPVDGSEALPLDVPVALVTPTYDGSGQVVHPDFAAAPVWWTGRGSYLGITPYPGGDQAKENPFLLASSDRLLWRSVAGAPNPIVSTPTGYLSDPDILFEPESRELWMYYRYVDGRNVIRLVRSGDGRHWSIPVDVAAGTGHTVVSPTVVRRDQHDWWMWSVNAGLRGCGAEETEIEVRRSTDGLTALFLSTSPDGLNWTARPNPLLVAGEIPELKDIVYRSTFSYNPTSDIITFWYSGASYNSSGRLVWRAAAQRRRREAVFNRTSGAYPSNSRRIPRSVRLLNPP